MKDYVSVNDGILFYQLNGQVVFYVIDNVGVSEILKKSI